MPVSLSRELRNELASVTKTARSRAEDAARAALENLAVHERQARGHMDETRRKLRAQLRARGKALGDSRQSDGSQELTRLVEHTAYEHWHRLLFTRFLTENHLLLMPDEAGGPPTPVTVEECEELAPEMGAKDGFDLACRFAGKTLPGVFRADDPVLDLTFAPEGQVALRKLLDSLPRETFTADDALGWTYQFWQAQRKDEVNKSGKKIGAAELSPVTQLFTEDYMVEFLLHNTLGAWWTGRCAAISNSKFQIANCATEADARAAVALPPKDGAPGIEWTYLRFVQNESTHAWTPAAGVFESWPKTVREITMLDPCMGSGHFLVFALPLLVRLRVEGEGLSAAAAVAAVLKDNLHGLELDERCTQIAAFNLALAAWKIAGYQQLPALHLACSGLAPHTTKAEWIALASDNEKLQRGMARLYKLFENAPVLGSLLNPRADGGDLLTAGFDELRPLVEKALAAATSDDTAREMAVTARGLAKAAELLAGQFILVATNVPYLGRGKQDERLMNYCERIHPLSKPDLATSFVERCSGFCASGGSTALVTPQNWLFLGQYMRFRESLLKAVGWRVVARLGARAFETITGEVVNVALVVHTVQKPNVYDAFLGLDVSERADASLKRANMLADPILLVNQLSQLKNPDARIIQREGGTDTQLLSERAVAYQGLVTGDRNSYVFQFWEIPKLTAKWETFADAYSGEGLVLGRENIIFWEESCGRLYKMAAENRDRLHDMHESGNLCWGKKGVLLTRIGLKASPYYGEKYDNNLICILPANEEELSAIWNFCSSTDYKSAVREIDQKLSLTNATACKVGVRLDDWQIGDGFPKPFSSDPTQWLFNGHPKGSDQPLHVAVARLLGYRWPRQTGSSFPDCPALDADGLESFADADGIVCLSPINREAPAAARLRHLLAAALGTYDERALLATSGQKGSRAKTLEEWLRDEFFEQHCALFHDRPFVWHIWDGLKDGFHVLVNYHRLENATLQKLTFSYLGEWIRQQADDAKAEKPGAAARLGAAKNLQDKLKAIFEGEAPLDIFVRWKPLKEQPIGWNPDLNDGVRQNIRPFLMAGDVGKKDAGLFRVRPLKLKDSDRGTEPERPRADYPWFWCEEDPGTDPKGGSSFVGTRWNTAHFTLATKRAARG
jgi:hypothetical protein